MHRAQAQLHLTTLPLPGAILYALADIDGLLTDGGDLAKILTDMITNLHLIQALLGLYQRDRLPGTSQAAHHLQTVQRIRFKRLALTTCIRTLDCIGH